MCMVSPTYNPFDNSSGGLPATFGSTYTFPAVDVEKELLRQLVEVHKQNAELWKMLAEERGKK